MFGYLSTDFICSPKLAVSLDLRSQKPVRLLERIIFVDKYPKIFPRQMEAIVYMRAR